jgi:hypothetical protein
MTSVSVAADGLSGRTKPGIVVPRFFRKKSADLEKWRGIDLVVCLSSWENSGFTGSSSDDRPPPSPRERGEARALGLMKPRGDGTAPQPVLFVDLLDREFVTIAVR